MRALMAAIVIACLPMTDARACHAMGSWQTIFFEPDDLAKGVDAPVAADVTVVAASMLPRNRLLLTAHVNKTIRGKLEGDDITIANSPSNCDEEILVGMLTWLGSARTISQGLLSLCSLFLVALGAGTIVWTFHLALVSGDMEFYMIVYGGSLIVQRMASLFGFAGDSRNITSI